MTMWELVVGGVLIATGIVLTYFFYGDLKDLDSSAAAFNDLDKKTIKAAEILHDLLKEEKI